jgi:hypothetical protein
VARAVQEENGEHCLNWGGVDQRLNSIKQQIGSKKKEPAENNVGDCRTTRVPKKYWAGINKTANP